MRIETSSGVLARGSLWVGAAEVVNVVASTIGTIVATRVLAPADFGVVGIAMLSLAVLEAFSNTGFHQALIQRKEGDIESYLNVAWTWQLVRGCTLAGLMAATAPALAAWYGLPELTKIVWTCSIVPVLNGLSNTGLLVFSRELAFGPLFAIQGLKAGVQLCLTIPAIILLRNEWGLVSGQVGGAVVGVVASYLAHPFRPRFDLDWQKTKSLVRFGKWVTGGALIAFLITQGDDLFVSRMLGVSALGYYQFAYQNANIPATKITHVLGQVSFPTYSRLQHDRVGLGRAFRGVARFTILLAAPTTVAIWFLIPHVVEHVIGAKWAPVIPLVRILAVAGLVRAVAALAGPLFLAAGRPELDFRMNLPRLVVLAVSIYPLTATHGLAGACFAVLLGTLCCIPTWISGVREITGLSLAQFLSDNLLAIVASALLAICMFLTHSPGTLTLVKSARSLFSGVGAWVASLFLLARIRPTLDVFGEIGRLRAVLKK